jgi:hypothetical protein
MSNDAPVPSFAYAGFGMGAGARNVSMMFTIITTRRRAVSG